MLFEGWPVPAEDRHSIPPNGGGDSGPQGISYYATASVFTGSWGARRLAQCNAVPRGHLSRNEAQSNAAPLVFCLKKRGGVCHGYQLEKKTGGFLANEALWPAGRASNPPRLSVPGGAPIRRGARGPVGSGFGDPAAFATFKASLAKGSGLSGPPGCNSAGHDGVLLPEAVVVPRGGARPRAGRGEGASRNFVQHAILDPLEMIQGSYEGRSGPQLSVAPPNAKAGRDGPEWAHALVVGRRCRRSSSAC